MSQNVKVHATAIVSSEVILGNNVEIGPYSILDGKIKIGDGTKIYSHAVLRGNTELGKSNTVYQFCSIGEPPQDNSYKGEDTRVLIGDNNTFREYVSIHRGTTKENRITTLGSNCLLMAKVHIAHDAVVGNNCTIVNSVNLAGHVKMGDRVIIGGGTNIGQFITLGRGAYIGGATAIDRDIPPFCTAYGNRVRLKGINIIGLRRTGVSKPVIAEVVDFFRLMESSAYAPRAFVNQEEHMREYKDNEIVQEMARAIRESEVGIAPFFI
ncbi:MAG: acyl-[acyl-carrier-protein]--UDP-N-acetylglucosamine O-acyltransferase [Bdellovibrionales bacterium GWA2_49_15]|nr:MAG: acyl-[acyl-carrier-protein]--UDP-N-acetylglucosamine O-acyltransferase [Bdellovibrionales bacterium GWA2_49_15]HAZ14043.1 acyl-[acyl-carrier-protein]--UDP-N-acetylglucosamine O-acyltransferase [Bdellovibrionales bacterium]